MKKLTLIMLVAMVPFFTMAQKRSKKTDKQVGKVEYMMIKGIEVSSEDHMDPKEKVEYRQSVEEQIHAPVRFYISFDFGGANSKESTELIRSAAEYRTMMMAVNGAVERGWEFVSANSTVVNGMLTHYYYMKRLK